MPGLPSHVPVAARCWRKTANNWRVLTSHSDLSCYIPSALAASGLSKVNNLAAPFAAARLCISQRILGFVV